MLVRPGKMAEEIRRTAAKELHSPARAGRRSSSNRLGGHVVARRAKQKEEGRKPGFPGVKIYGGRSSAGSLMPGSGSRSRKKGGEEKGEISLLGGVLKRARKGRR